MARQADRPFEQLKLTKDGFLELYSVDGPLGEGAFGAVMRGTDKRSGEGIAIKMIDKAQAAGAADEEIRVWRLVRHPACVCLLGVYDLTLYMALCCELCAGGTLLDRLAKAEDFMSEAQAQRLACELLAALLHLHEVGVAHRDIKPANVLCTAPSPLELAQAHGGARGDSGVALLHLKLADFGLSATFDPDAGGACFYGCVGTAEYMAPQTPTLGPSLSPSPSLSLSLSLSLTLGTWRPSSCSSSNGCAAAAAAAAAAARRGSRHMTSASTGGRRAAWCTSYSRAGRLASPMTLALPLILTPAL